MMKTWIFFKLRMLQLKYDKTALFFCYVFPVILLLGIGYPLQLQSDPKIEVYYQDFAANEESKATIALLDEQKLIELKPYEESIPAYEAVADNDVKRVLTILAQDKAPDLTAYGVDVEPAQVANEKLGTISLHLIKNDIDENRIENAALASAIDQLVSGDTEIELDQYTLKSDRLTSYLVTLLPGLIGLTLMIIGFNGFGSVLIEEEHHGLFKNIKTIDVSPVPFLAGLFLSRLLVSHSVAIGLCLVAMLVFGIKFDFNIPMFFLVVTLGSIAFLGIGLFIATVSPSTTAFNGIVNFVQMPFIVLGGVFFSVSLFPDWLQYIALAIPLTQLNVAMQKVLFEPNDMNVIGGMSLELVVLFAWCVVSVVISKMKFKW